MNGDRETSLVRVAIIDDHSSIIEMLSQVVDGISGYKVVGYRNVVNYGANKLRFISPVPAGAKVHARSRLVAVEERPQGTQVTQETTVNVVGQDKPALIYEGIFLYVKP